MDCHPGFAEYLDRGRKIMKKFWCSLIAALTLAICLSGISFSQEINGSIVGSVKDSNGATIAGATVTITDQSKNTVVRTVTTNDDGLFTVPNVPVSTYSVTVEAPNFKKSVNTDVKVDVGQRRPLDVILAAGNVSETV